MEADESQRRQRLRQQRRKNQTLLKSSPVTEETWMGVLIA